MSAAAAYADRLPRSTTPSAFVPRRGIGLPGLVHEVLHSSGEPLEAASRALFEPRFGHDFSQVRVHTDAKAAESARATNSLAYTVGNQIVFGEGRYAPRTAAGQRLMAHELTHVLQQRCGAAADSMLSSSSLQIGREGDAFEREAQAAASSLTSSARPLTQELAGDKACLLRQPDEEERRGQRESDPLPYREAMETTEQGLYKEYQRDCAGVDVLKRLEPFVKPRESPDVAGKELTMVERTEFSPREIVQRLERRVTRLPDILARREAVKEEMKKPGADDAQKKTDLLGKLAKKDPDNLLLRQAKLRRFDEIFIEPEFGRDYGVGSLEGELAKARCELSKARWEFMVFVRTRRLPGARRIPRG